MCFASLRSRALAVFAIGLAVATGASRAEATQNREGPFVGTLPCADCEGIRTELTLWREAGSGAPSRFLLRETYLGKPRGAEVFESSGPWHELGAGAATADRRVRIDPFQPNTRRTFLRLGPALLELLDRDERRVSTVLNMRLELAPPVAPAGDAPPRVLLAGMLRTAGAAGLQLQRCGEIGAQRAIDVSPENSVTAALTDIGLDRRSALYVEAFGHLADGTVMIERLNRAGAEMRCVEAGAGLRWQAQGNEPFWALRADAMRTTFVQPGEEPIAHPSIDLTWRWRGGRRDDARAHLHSQTEAGTIEALLEPRICRDTMADAAYGYRAEVAISNPAARETFSGCAYLGAGTALP